MKGNNKIHPPIIATGMWHAGTRILVNLLECAGIDFGNQKFAMSPNTKDFGDLKFNRFCQSLVLRNKKDLIPTDGERKYITKLLSKYFDFSRPWGFKMPIISYIIPYFIRLYPDCKIVAIYRDGRDVALSRIGLGVPTDRPHLKDYERLKNYIRFYLLSYIDWLKFKKLKLKCFFGTTNIKEFYGVRFSDVNYLKAKVPPHVHVFAAQLWMESTLKLIESRKYKNYYEVRYEPLCQTPQKIIPNLLKDLDITGYDNLDELIKIPRSTRIGKWKTADKKVVEEIIKTAEPLLKILEYI